MTKSQKVEIPKEVYHVDIGEDTFANDSADERADEILEMLGTSDIRGDVILFHLHLMYKLGYAKANGVY